MIYAAKAYVQEILGIKYTNFRPPELAESFKETTSKTPIFFILSAGVDPTRVNIIYYLINMYYVVYCVLQLFNFFFLPVK